MCSFVSVFRKKGGRKRYNCKNDETRKENEDNEGRKKEIQDREEGTKEDYDHKEIKESEGVKGKIEKQNNEGRNVDQDGKRTGKKKEATETFPVTKKLLEASEYLSFIDRQERRKE